MSTAQATGITFHFDPSCPWTWATSRWLVEAAGARGIEVHWRSLSLSVLNAGVEVPEAYRPGMDAAVRAHRIMAALLADGREDLVAAFYTEYGRRAHHDGVAPSRSLAADAAAAAGAEVWAPAAEDGRWDGAVERATIEAVDLAGPDVGSPVLSWGEPRRAFFGPVVSPPPTGDAALALLDLVLAAGEVPGFYELKRGRRTGPQFGPRP